MDTYITTAEAARLLQVQQATAQKHALRGNFPGAFKVGEGKRGTWWIPERDVLAYRQQRRIGRPPQPPVASDRRQVGRPPEQEAGATETKGENDG